MRRLAVIGAIVLALPGGWLVAGAGADDTSHSYRIEMLNAFGIFEGSDVRVNGVRAGSVTGVGVNGRKRAVVEIELEGPLAVLGDRTTCSTEPQSLIAEYFIDCEPLGTPLPEGAEIPASRVTQSIQTDLLFNTLRTPVRERLRLIVNDLGTAMAGNSANLNEGIRMSVPALTQLRRVTGILHRQRGRLAEANAAAGEVIGRLAERHGDVVRATAAARDAAVVAQSQHANLRRDADRLDDFTAELGPMLRHLDRAATAGTPLLRRLRAAAPGLNDVVTMLPGFGRAASDALVALGRATGPGRDALTRGRDELEALRAAGRKAPLTAEVVADFLRDLADPRRAVEVDARAAKRCDRSGQPCWGTGRPAPTGFTGLESLLNYVYYQAGALNQFDSLGHILQFDAFDVATGPCGGFNARPDIPAIGGGRTTDILKADPCVEWLGPNQPDVSFDLGLPPYDPSVCPDGSTDLALCDPSGPARRARAAAASQRHRSPALRPGDSALGTPAVPRPAEPSGGLHPAPEGLRPRLDDLLGLGRRLPRPGAGSRARPDPVAGTRALLDFLLGG